MWSYRQNFGSKATTSSEFNQIIGFPIITLNTSQTASRFFLNFIHCKRKNWIQVHFKLAPEGVPSSSIPMTEKRTTMLQSLGPHQKFEWCGLTCLALPNFKQAPKASIFTTLLGQPHTLWKLFYLYLHLPQLCLKTGLCIPSEALNTRLLATYLSSFWLSKNKNKIK